jgi:hypothetical protein
MSNKPLIVSDGIVSPQQLESEPSGFMAVIERLAMNKDVDVEKLERMMAMNERMMAKQAEIEFNQALTRLQKVLPTVLKKGAIEFEDKNKVQRHTPYARYEDIDEAIREHLLNEGFSLSFDTEWGQEGATIFGTLSHVGGHSKTARLRLPLDSSGSKNNLQAMGSTIAYGQRYLVKMLLNIVTKGEDDDGDRGGSPRITEEQERTIEEWLSETKGDKKALLKFARAKSIGDIKASEYDKIIALFKKKGAQNV